MNEWDRKRQDRLDAEMREWRKMLAGSDHQWRSVEMAAVILASAAISGVNMLGFLISR